MFPDSGQTECALMSVRSREIARCNYSLMAVVLSTADV